MDPDKTLVSVTLPNTRNVVIMAMGFGTNNTVVVSWYIHLHATQPVHRAGRYRYAFGILYAQQPSWLHVRDRSVQLVVTKATP